VTLSLQKSKDTQPTRFLQGLLITKKISKDLQVRETTIRPVFGVSYQVGRKVSSGEGSRWRNPVLSSARRPVCTTTHPSAYRYRVAFAFTVKRLVAASPTVLGCNHPTAYSHIAASIRPVRRTQRRVLSRSSGTGG